MKKMNRKKDDVLSSYHTVINTCCFSSLNIDTGDICDMFC